MGGPVAQLIWQRHPDRVAGLVLAATAAQFAMTPGEARWFSAIAGVGTASRVVPDRARRRVRDRLLRGRHDDTPTGRWAESEVKLGDPRAILEAGGELGRHDARSWLPSIDVPATVLVTARDRIVPPARQRAMADAIPGAHAPSSSRSSTPAA